MEADITLGKVVFFFNSHREEEPMECNSDSLIPICMKTVKAINDGRIDKNRYDRYVELFKKLKDEYDRKYK